MKHYTIHNRWALGDTVVLSAFIRDLHITYPDQYRISVIGSYANVVWLNNRYVDNTNPDAGELLNFEYSDGIIRSKSGVVKHFISAYYAKFEEQTGVKVPVLFPHGHIELSCEEKEKRFVDKPYWVILAGGKTDITTKLWSPQRYQEVTDRLTAAGITLVQAGALTSNSIQQKLNNCISLLGQTRNERDFFSLIANADGVICGVTAAMHIAACFHKPCVVLAGGREEYWWEWYGDIPGQQNFGPMCAPVKTPHVYLHTQGDLDCCAVRGCWLTQMVPVNSGAHAAKKHCQRPMTDGKEIVPACLERITTDQVVDAVLHYDTTPKLIQVKPTMTATDWVPLTIRDPYVVMDHPVIGGKVTVCLLTWGDHIANIYRCLDGILNSVPLKYLDIRVGLNQPGERSLRYVQELQKSGKVTAYYLDTGSRRKYPAMREMFYDAANPITTEYVIWFDDDTSINNPDWLILLCQVIVANHGSGARLFGKKYRHDVAIYRKHGNDPLQWFKNAEWWRGINLRDRVSGAALATGTVIDFVAGYFWALHYPTAVAAGIPDIRLNHNGGDCTIGEQVHQAGYAIKSVNDNKEWVTCPAKSSGGRRGYSEAFPWADPQTKATHVCGT